MVLIQPANSILLDGDPMLETLKVEVATNMFGGRLVTRGTNDDDIVVAGANATSLKGWLSYEHTHKNDRPATVDTIYAINAQAVVLSGGHFRLLATLAAGENVTQGQYLVSAAAGMVQLASALTVTIANGTIAVLSDKAQPDEVAIGAYGSEGVIVARAAQSVDATLAAADIIVESWI